MTMKNDEFRLVLKASSNETRRGSESSALAPR